MHAPLAAGGLMSVKASGLTSAHASALASVPTSALTSVPASATLRSLTSAMKAVSQRIANVGETVGARHGAIVGGQPRPWIVNRYALSRQRTVVPRRHHWTQEGSNTECCHWPGLRRTTRGASAPVGADVVQAVCIVLASAGTSVPTAVLRSKNLGARHGSSVGEQPRPRDANRYALSRLRTSGRIGTTVHRMLEYGLPPLARRSSCNSRARAS